MSYELETLLWDNSGSSDKIWGWVRSGDNFFCFWGKRQVVDKDGLTENGKRPSLQFKMFKDARDLHKLCDTKTRKNYRYQNTEEVDNVVPGFTDFFESALVMARMLGKVRADDWADC